MLMNPRPRSRSRSRRAMHGARDAWRRRATQRRRGGALRTKQYQRCTNMLFQHFNDMELFRISAILKIKGSEDAEKFLSQLQTPKKRARVIRACKKKIRRMWPIWCYALRFPVWYPLCFLKELITKILQIAKMIVTYPFKMFTQKKMFRRSKAVVGLLRALIAFSYNVSLGFLRKEFKLSRQDRNNARKLHKIFQDCLERVSKQLNLSPEQLKASSAREQRMYQDQLAQGQQPKSATERSDALYAAMQNADRDMQRAAGGRRLCHRTSRGRRGRAVISLQHAITQKNL